MEESVQQTRTGVSDTPVDPQCPICRIFEAVCGQQLPVALALFKAIRKVRCQCKGHTHQPLVAHPHTPKSCRGYVKVVTL